MRTAALDRLDRFVAEIGSATWDGQQGFTWAPGAGRFATREYSYVNVLGLGARLRRQLAGLPGVTVDPLIRFSPHYYNTEDEIDRAPELVAALAKLPAPYRTDLKPRPLRVRLR